MNTLDAFVKKVMSKKPRYQYEKYWIKVEYLCYGLTSTTDLMFDTEEEAKSIKEGYKFPSVMFANTRVFFRAFSHDKYTKLYYY